MVVDSPLDEARATVRTELEATDGKLDAFETFIRRVREIRPQHPSASTVGPTTAGGSTRLSMETPGANRCRTVRTAFDETVRAHSVADIDTAEPLLETIREEFTDAIAVALAPTTDASFTPDLKRAVIEEAQSRRAEAEAFRTALAREHEQLDEAAAVVDETIAWIEDVNGTPLTDLGFDSLRDRHETLAAYRDQCATVARARQAFLQETTANGMDAGVRHRRLVSYLYPELPVDYPVLAGIATLDETCRECQRAVREHLSRRG
ncbi:DUF7260 family protein [Natronomonas sp. EA1]|uniref:DUF7260 family protein n=1 Tax=Natronomonas sp. EA1 TaxID=3421655 RepID=UPI003EBD003F